MKPRVLLDCDGVLAGFVGNWLRLINIEFGTGYVLEDVTGWDICDSLGLVADQRSRAKRLIAECPEFARRHEVLAGSVDGVKALQEIAEVYIVTSPWNSHPTWTSDREWWLKKHFGIGSDRVVHTSAKHIVAGDYLVDDKTDGCEKWRGAWPLGTAVRWNTPHNKTEAWSGPETSSWATLADWVRCGVSQAWGNR